MSGPAGAGPADADDALGPTADAGGGQLSAGIEAADAVVRRTAVVERVWPSATIVERLDAESNPEVYVRLLAHPTVPALVRDAWQAVLEQGVARAMASGDGPETWEDVNWPWLRVGHPAPVRVAGRVLAFATAPDLTPRHLVCALGTHAPCRARLVALARARDWVFPGLRDLAETGLAEREGAPQAFRLRPDAWAAPESLGADELDGLLELTHPGDVHHPGALALLADPRLSVTRWVDRVARTVADPFAGDDVLLLLRTAPPQLDAALRVTALATRLLALPNRAVRLHVLARRAALGRLALAGASAVAVATATAAHPAPGPAALTRRVGGTPTPSGPTGRGRPCA